MLGTALAIISQSVNAQTSVGDYWAFGVLDSNLYGFTSESTRTVISTELTASPNTFRANHLATDTARNRVIYGLHRIDDSTVQSIWAWDFNTNTRVNISTPNGIDLAFIGNSTGGAGFYNGDYYLWDDGGAQQGLVRFTFDETGNIASATKPWGNITSVGGLGDIAIDASGMMYILTDGTAGNRLYRMDLNDSLATPVLLGDYSGYVSNGQLFIDQQGRLLTRQLDSGNWLSLDPLSPGVFEVIPGPAVFAEYADLSEGALVGVVVPEPSGALLLGLAGAVGLSRRKRAS